MPDQTRRGFLASTGTIAGIFTLDEDGDGEYLDDILGMDDEDATASGEGVYVIEGDPNAEPPDHERIEPERTPALLIEPDGRLFGWDEDEEAWRFYRTTGPNPELESIIGAQSGAEVYNDETQTFGDGTTQADHEAINTEAVSYS